MGVQAEDNREEIAEQVVEETGRNGKGYNKKISVSLYKRFTLLTFAVYYINCMVRIITRCVSYYNSKEITTFAQWWTLVTSLSNWKETVSEIFDWYTITLIVFLFLYAIVFLFTFIRFSPKNKKTFKYFKKGFLMARRIIKIINLALSITVLINSAQLLTFVDKFLFVISLFSLIFTFLQICVSVTAWIVSRRINKNYSSVKAYVGKMGNVVSSYVLTSRVRAGETRDGAKKTIGDKLGDFRNRFVHTVEALTYTEEEARASDMEYADQYIAGDAEDETDRFENDYVPPENVRVEDAAEKETSVKGKSAKHKSKSGAKKKTVKSTSQRKSHKPAVKKTKTVKKNVSAGKKTGGADKRNEE